MSRGASSSFMNSYLRGHEQYKHFMHDFLTLPVHFLTLLCRFLPFQESRDLFLSQRLPNPFHSGGGWKRNGRERCFIGCFCLLFAVNLLVCIAQSCGRWIRDLYGETPFAFMPQRLYVSHPANIPRNFSVASDSFCASSLDIGKKSEWS